MAANRTITISVPESHARRMEQIEKRPLQEIVQEHTLNWFEDGRRKSIEGKRQGISWHTEVYAALLKHVGVGGISRFVREAVYENLSRLERDLMPCPAWKEGRKQKSSLTKRVSPADRLAVQAPIEFPAQWIERIEARHPNRVSNYIKACAQIKLEKQIKRELPTQKGMGVYLGR